MPELQPRIPLLPREEWDDETRALLGDGTPLNIFSTLAHHPKLMKRWMVFGSHILAKNTLSARDRELLILRTGWNCRAPYEWGQHVVIARQSGIDDDTITRVSADIDAGSWPANEAALLRAADQLHEKQALDDTLYATLAEHYDTQQLLDIVFTVGQYTLVSMALNAFRVERDDGVTDVVIPTMR